MPTSDSYDGLVDDHPCMEWGQVPIVQVQWRVGQVMPKTGHGHVEGGLASATRAAAILLDS